MSSLEHIKQEVIRINDFQSRFCKPDLTDPTLNIEHANTYTIPRLKKNIAKKLNDIRDEHINGLPCMLSFGIGPQWHLSILISIHKFPFNHLKELKVDQLSNEQTEVISNQVYIALNKVQLIKSLVDFKENVTVELTDEIEGVNMH
jgi:hypothetical protein